MKKFISVLLAFTIVFCSVLAVDLSSYAQDNSDTKILYINPMLENQRKEIEKRLCNASEGKSNVVTFSLKAATSYPTVEQAALTLKNAMVNRQTTIPIKFISSISNPDRAISDLLEKALSQEYSTSSQDGDYLKWHISGCGYSGNFGKTSDGYLYDIKIVSEYLTTAAQEAKVSSKLNEISSRLRLSEKSDYMKAIDIHDYLCKIIRYDYVNLNDNSMLDKFSAYGGLFEGYAVCQGYATLFYRLCVENGLSSRVVTSEEHAWNIVKVYGNYYFVDCTWDDSLYDDPRSSSGHYWADEYGWDYFLYGQNDYNDYMHILESPFTTSAFRNKYPISNNRMPCPHEAEEKQIPDGFNCETGFTGDLFCRVCDIKLGTYTISSGSTHSYLDTTVAPTCTEKGYTLHACLNCDSEYTDSYKNALGHQYNSKSSISKATTSSNGKITTAYTCNECGYNYSKVTSTIYAPKTFTMATTAVYNGKVKTPAVTVKDSKGKTLVKGTDYTVSYASGRKNVGKYAVKITFKGNYSGTKTLYFTIKPKNTSISGITAGSKKFTVKIKKYTTQTTGYQIQYAMNTKFTKAKTVTVGNKTTSKTISKLAGKKKYYVRIRTYKTVGGTKYYSAWSKYKAVTTKK